MQRDDFLDGQVKIDCDLDCPDLSPDHKLHRVLNAANKNNVALGQINKLATLDYFWNAEHFSLDDVGIFRDLNQDMKNKVLKRCSQGVLEETYFIEKAGITFAAKMILLGESTQEKMLYSHFASDEAAHLQLIQKYLAELPSHTQHNSFLNLLTEVIETGDKTSLTFIIQIILEGWGLNHYRTLSHGCLDENFKESINIILKDEAQHYRSGVILFDSKLLTSFQKKWVLDVLIRFFQMVQAGPQQVVSNIETVVGHLSRSQRIKIFEELKCENHIQERLKILSNLIKLSPFNEEVESYGVLKPWTAQQCAGLSTIPDSENLLSASL
jgi:hypothetical protein